MNFNRKTFMCEICEKPMIIKATLGKLYSPIVQTVCQRCRGEGYYYESIQNRGTLEYREFYSNCSSCKSNGFYYRLDWNKLDVTEWAMI